MTGHAPLAPSSAPIWGFCSGSVNASKGRHSKANERTIQGTAAHWVMEQCLKNWRDPEPTTDLFCKDFEGKHDEDGTLITADIAEGAQYILDDVLKVCMDNGGYSSLLIEQRVHMTMIHPTDNWGTLDVGLYFPQAKRLFLWDYKHGFSLVRAKGNLQLIDYVEGLYESYAMPQDTQIHMRIVQPFAYAPWGAVDEHVCYLGELFPAFSQLKAKAQEAYTNPTLTAGTHCRYCPAREDCSAARTYAYMWGSVAEMPYFMDSMTTDDKARELDLLRGAIQTIKGRADAIEDSLLNDMRNGNTCTVKTRETSQGRLNWHKGSAPAAIAAFKALGLDIEKHEPRTPTQVLQAAPKEMKDTAAAIVNSMATREISLKIVDSSDSIVARAFGAKTL